MGLPSSAHTFRKDARDTSMDGLYATPRFQPSPAMAAKLALFEAGLELAGVRVQQFAERLLEVADASPAAAPGQLVRAAVAGLDGGALALVAEEPELCNRRLSRAATTVQEAADTVVDALGLALLDAHKKL